MSGCIDKKIVMSADNWKRSPSISVSLDTVCQCGGGKEKRGWGTWAQLPWYVVQLSFKHEQMKLGWNMTLWRNIWTLRLIFSLWMQDSNKIEFRWIHDASFTLCLSSQGGHTAASTTSVFYVSYCATLKGWNSEKSYMTTFKSQQYTFISHFIRYICSTTTKTW